MYVVESIESAQEKEEHNTATTRRGEKREILLVFYRQKEVGPLSVCRESSIIYQLITAYSPFPLLLTHPHPHTQTDTQRKTRMIEYACTIIRELKKAALSVRACALFIDILLLLPSAILIDGISSSSSSYSLPPSFWYTYVK